MGGGMIAATVGIVVAIFAALLGVLYYPIKRFLKNRKIHAIYVEIAETKKNYDIKKNFIQKYLREYNFELKFSLPIRSFSFLSNLKATDNLFINKDFKLI